MLFYIKFYINTYSFNIIYIHNHFIYGIDDGSTSLEQSIKILNILEKGGVTDIVVTPHYIEGTNYNSNNKTKQSLLKKLLYI